MSVSDWLEHRIGAPRSGQTTLVLCRGRATTALVRRWVASRGGWMGIEVVTAHGLAAGVHRPALDAPQSDEPGPMPEDNPMAARIGARPGLVATARRWVRRTRENRAVGAGADGLPPWLIALDRSGWADDGDSERLDTLIRLAGQDLKNLTESHHYDRVVLVGFDSGLAGVDPASKAIAAAMTGGAALPVPAPAPARAIPAILVPDVVAEARQAARLCLERPHDTLVLVSEEATGRRLRDALYRNGVPCGFVHPHPAAASALGALVQRIGPWFESQDAPLRVSDVGAVFSSPALTGLLRPVAARALERERSELGLDQAELRLSRRRLTALLGEARVLDAPLSRWLGRLRLLALDPARADSIRGAAVALEVRLKLVDACVRGTDFQAAFAGDDGPDWDDFDDLLLELLGDTDGAIETLQPCSLGGIHRLLGALRARVHDHQGARAILATLGALRERPASATTVREALGVQVDPGALGSGVDVLYYDDWDGRPAGRLVLLDVHHKGMARRPTPDPLLTEAEQRALGVLAGQALVDHRIDQVHGAAAAAGEVVAVVAERDAGGRDLVPPIQLELVASATPTRTYGLDVELPETRRHQALVVTHDPPADAAPSGPLAHLLLQASVEWYRAGQGPLPDPDRERVAGRFVALDERLRAVQPLWPEYLGPWMGDSTGVSEASLTHRAWSSSGLFQPLAACMYRAYAGAVLGLKEREEIPEDLDPREIGTAIHDALEHVGAGLKMRVPRDEVQQAREAMVSALRQSTRDRLAQTRAQLDGLSEARQTAITGRMERWNAHWPSWAASRVRALERADRKLVWNFVRSHPYTQAAAEAMAAEVPGAARYDQATLQSWVLNTGQSLHRGEPVHNWAPALLAREGDRYGGLSADMHQGLRAWLDSDAIRQATLVWKSAEIRADGVGLPVDATGVEIPFGPREGAGKLTIQDQVVDIALGELEIPLGAHKIAISGRIDRLVITLYRGTRPLIEVLDYKTGRTKPPSTRGAWLDLWAGQSPQLILYALALREAIALGRLGEPYQRGLIASVGWDHVRHTFGDQGGSDRTPVSNELGRILVDNVVLDAIADRLGALVDRGRVGNWPLHPRPGECPAVSGAWARCAFHGACRLQDLPPVAGR